MAFTQNPDGKFVGTNGDDTLVAATSGDDFVEGLGGNDFVNAGEGDDIVNGGDGRDTIFGEDGADTLNGNDGNDHIVGGDGIDTLNGGKGNDTLFATNDPNISGGVGADTSSNTLNGGEGYDTAVGGAGVDTITDAEIVHAGAGNDDITVNNLTVSSGFAENHKDISIYGQDGNDTIRDSGLYDANSAATNYRFDGGKGDDNIIAGANANGNYTIIGGQGNDTLVAGAGKDTFVFNQGHGNDIVTGFDFGQDTLSFDASVFRTAEEALAAVKYTDTGAIITTGNNSEVFIEGAGPGSLTANDFEITNLNFQPSTTALGAVGAAAFAGLAIGAFSYANMRSDFSKLVHKKVQLGYESQLNKYSQQNNIPRSEMSLKDVRLATNAKHCLERNNLIHDKQEFVKNARNTWTVSGAITGLAIGATAAMLIIPAVPALATIGVAASIALSSAAGAVLAVTGAVTARVVGGKAAAAFADKAISCELKNTVNLHGINLKEAESEKSVSEKQADKIMAKVENQDQSKPSFAERFSSSKRSLAEIKELYKEKLELSHAQRELDSKTKMATQQQSVA